MAGGNWASSSFDNEGKSAGCVNHLGSQIEIYKSYILIRNEKMWYEQCGFVKPIIAQILEGDLKIAGFEIKTKRKHDPESIFVFASYWKDDTWTEKLRFAGIGSYGWGVDGEWDDVTPETQKEFVSWLESFNYKCDEFKSWIEKVRKRCPM
jgi:hypothetical protein